MAYTKGSGARDAEYAKGGEPTSRVRNFMKEPDEFRDPDEGDAKADEDQLYGKEGEGKGTGCGTLPKSRDKSLKAVKPRK